MIAMCLAFICAVAALKRLDAILFERFARRWKRK